MSDECGREIIFPREALATLKDEMCTVSLYRNVTR